VYKGDGEAQINLWSDNRIKVIKDAAKRNEPKLIESSKALKAAGTSSGMSLSLLHPLALLILVAPDTYTPEELVHCFRWFLVAASGPRGIHICGATTLLSS
jgi:hypothetical protein